MVEWNLNSTDKYKYARIYQSTWGLAVVQALPDSNNLKFFFYLFLDLSMNLNL